MPDSENESVPPDPNETAIFAAEAEQQNLCNRCRSMNLDYMSRISPRVHVPVSSLELGCCYCDNFREIVSDFVSGSTYTVHEIQLVRTKAIHSERFIATLDLVVDTGLTQEGKPVTYDESYDLVPLESQRKGFRQTVKNCVRDEPAGFSMIKSSLEECRTSHSDCHGKSYGMSVPLKVLDCQSRTLRTINPDESYAALSYVWGNVPAEPLLNHQALLLPKTIEDALSVCRRVGIQYIWVDRYCIDQDNPQDKHTLISQMDKIYRGAEFTIIAAAGETPDYGLPGVNGTPRRHHQIDFKTLNSSFTASRRLHQQVRSSTWSTRGWTYQEVLLSSRRVYFTDWEIVFECQTLCAREMVSDDLLSAKLGFIPIYSWLKSNQSYDEIYQRLREYRRRKLTYSEDTIRAVEGIIHSFQFTCNTSWPFGASEGQHTIIHFYGAPCTSYKPWRNLTFLNSLLWQVFDLTVSTEILQMFPSWSWAVARTSASGTLLFPGMSTSLETEEQIWPLLITLSHYVRGEEILLDLGVHDDYTSYHPWFRIDTWLLNGRAEHPVTAPRTNFVFDKKESQKTDSIMAIVLKTLRRNWFTGIQCLLVEQIAPGDFRRVGFCGLTINKLEDLRNPTWDEYKNANPGGLWGKDLHSSMKLVKAAFLKQVQELVPDMTWELQERNLRLV